MKPLRELAPRVFATEMQISNDIKGGKNWKESALDRILETMKQFVAGKPLQCGCHQWRSKTMDTPTKEEG